MGFKWLTSKRLIKALKQIPQIQKISKFRVASTKQLLDKIKPLNTTVERERKRQEKLKKSSGFF